SRARLRRHAVERLPLRDTAADHAGCHRRRADGVHALDRRFRDHVFHRRRRHGDAAAADLLDDQDRRDAGGERGIQPVDAADAGAYHHRIQSLSHAAAFRGAGMKRASSPMRRALLASLPPLAFALLTGTALAKDEFHLYNWNNYIAPETIKRFED